jgi:hypothetical protein
MRSKTFKIIITIVIILIALRLALPYVLLHYAEYRINKIPEYHVRIGDIDVHLWRGSYTIKAIRLDKINSKIPVPFFSADAVDLAVDWRALLTGAFVAQLALDHPSVNFVVDPKGQNEQTSIDKQWQDAVAALFPFNFNKIVVEDGSLHFRSFTSDPPFDLYLKNINARLDNIRNITAKLENKLSSSLTLTANTMDGADVQGELHFDPLTKQPTFELKASVEQMRIKEANNFLRHYVKFDVESGLFSLYVEAAAANGKINGYAKPIIKDLKVTKENMGPIEALYKGALQVATKILENPNKKTVATRIVIKGNIDDPDTSLWSIIGNLLHHAFIQALLPQLDHNIHVQDINVGKQD